MRGKRFEEGMRFVRLPEVRKRVSGQGSRIRALSLLQHARVIQKDAERGDARQGGVTIVLTRFFSRRGLRAFVFRLR